MSEPTRSKRSFLGFVDAGEREVARLLTLITAVVISAAIIQLIVSMGSKSVSYTHLTLPTIAIV